MSESTMIIEIEAKHLAVLHELLKRTPLKGEEVPDFVDVLNTLNSAINKGNYIDNTLKTMKKDSSTN